MIAMSYYGYDKYRGNENGKQEHTGGGYQEGLGGK